MRHDFFLKRAIILLIIFSFYKSSHSLAQDSTIVFNSKRSVVLEGGSNFRDLGGYPAANGKIVKWRKIFRSADISTLTVNDLALLESRKITTVCDLRSPEEIKSKPDKMILGAHYVNQSAGNELGNSPINYASMDLDSMMRAFYSRTDYLKAKYKPMFDELLALPKDNAMLFHCTAGKDRTGIGAALILSALKVDNMYIVADYEATNQFWNSNKMKENMEKAGIQKSNTRALITADPNYIILFLRAIDKKYGSMSNFLKTEMELSTQKQRLLTRKYLKTKDVEMDNFLL